MKKLVFILSLFLTLSVGARTLDLSGADSPNKNNNNWQAIAEYMKGWINTDVFSTVAKDNALVYAKHAQLTSVQVEAGYVWLNSIPGKQIWLLNATMLPVSDSCANATNITIEEGDGTDVAAFLASSLLAGTVVPLHSSGAVTLSSEVAQGMAEGEGMHIVATGGSLTGCNYIDIVTEYMIQ